MWLLSLRFSEGCLHRRKHYHSENETDRCRSAEKSIVLSGHWHCSIGPRSRCVRVELVPKFMYLTSLRRKFFLNTSHHSTHRLALAIKHNHDASPARFTFASFPVYVCLARWRVRPAFFVIASSSPIENSMPIETQPPCSFCSCFDVSSSYCEPSYTALNRPVVTERRTCALS